MGAKVVSVALEPPLWSLPLEKLAAAFSDKTKLILLNTPMNKIHLILNRANSKVKLEVSEVERTLQVKADALIPSDIVVPQSVNKGTPVVIDAPRSAIAKSLEQLADRFAPRVDTKKKKGR